MSRQHSFLLLHQPVLYLCDLVLKVPVTNPEISVKQRQGRWE